MEVGRRRFLIPAYLQPHLQLTEGSHIFGQNYMYGQYNMTIHQTCFWCLVKPLGITKYGGNTGDTLLVRFTFQLVAICVKDNASA